MGLTLVLLSLAAVFLCGVWERKRPARHFTPEGATRWVANVGLYACCQFVPYLTVLLWHQLDAWGNSVRPWRWPGSEVDASPVAMGVGLAAGFLLLDGAGYAAHRCLHAFGPLWRLHKVHHSDAEFDATLSFRFHPGEILWSSSFRVCVMTIAGLPDPCVLIYALVNALHGAFSHANAHLPESVERALRRVMITPDLHRTHHAMDRLLSSWNYGIVLSCWDRIFGTWQVVDRSVPSAFGVEELRDVRPMSLGSLLLLSSDRPDGTSETPSP